MAEWGSFGPPLWGLELIAIPPWTRVLTVLVLLLMQQVFRTYCNLTSRRGYGFKLVLPGEQVINDVCVFVTIRHEEGQKRRSRPLPW